MNATGKPAKDAIAQTLRELLNGKEAYFPTHLWTSYPNIVDKICTLWQEPKVLHEYFAELMTTQREKRAGFPPDIHREIFMLSNYYSTIHPRPKTNDDFWNGLDMR